MLCVGVYTSTPKASTQEAHLYIYSCLLSAHRLQMQWTTSSAFEIIKILTDQLLVVMLVYFSHINNICSKPPAAHLPQTQK